MKASSNTFRLLSIAISTRGFGYAVMEGNNDLVAFGARGVKGDKNVRCRRSIEKLLKLYWPDVLVLYDVKAKDARRGPRTQRLHEEIMTLAKQQKLKIAVFPITDVRSSLLSNSKATKHELAISMAKKFPDELASRLPPKRRPWMSEDRRMDIFDAVSLACAYRLKHAG